jgi:hypothetical protein
VTMFAVAHYHMHGNELGMKSQQVTNLAEPTHLQDAATSNYINSALARKKLGSQLFLLTRTTTF